MNILVRAPNWIGDQILAYPFYFYLRKGFPKAHITVACVSWVRSVQFRDLINEVVVLPVQKDLSLWDRFLRLEASAGLLRNKAWDLGISLPNSFSAAWLLWRAGVKRRRGYRVDARSLLLNESLKWNPDPNRHRSQAYVDLLPDEARPRREVKDFWQRRVDPTLVMDEELEDRSGELKVFRFEESWSGAGNEVDWLEPPEKDYWVMAPGSNAESRRWPLESYAQLAELIHQETGWSVAIVGGATEADLAQRLLERLGRNAIDLTARGSVASLARVFRQARFSVTNESGLAHVASLCGSPTHIVCGAADPRRTQPLGPARVQVSVNSIDCWPCERNVCLQPPERKIQCLKGIEPRSVWEEIRRGFGL